MEIQDIKSVYFVGIGGIGTIALARYVVSTGGFVGGYDSIACDLIGQLREACADIQ